MKEWRAAIINHSRALFPCATLQNPKGKKKNFTIDAMIVFIITWKLGLQAQHTRDCSFPFSTLKQLLI